MEYDLAVQVIEQGNMCSQETGSPITEFPQTFLKETILTREVGFHKYLLGVS